MSGGKWTNERPLISPDPGQSDPVQSLHCEALTASPASRECRESEAQTPGQLHNPGPPHNPRKLQAVRAHGLTVVGKLLGVGQLTSSSEVVLCSRLP